MLRDFQLDMRGKIFAAWGTPNTYNVMPVLPTGGGKTVLFCDIVANYGAPSAVIAHRQELVAQASLALNRERVPHGILAPKAVQKQIIALHHETHGYSNYQFRSETKVAGVDTLNRHDAKDPWFARVGLVVQDEGHHVLQANKWGTAMALFPRARGLFPTAHCYRADRAGLGRNADGLVDSLVVGPSCRELINRGFLTDYRILCPGNDIDFSDVSIGSTGDYSMPKLRAATHKSNTIVGNVVKHYLRHAAGKLGVTFAVDIEAAQELATAYNDAGVPAQVITADTPIQVRGDFMRKFRNRTLLQLVSVDCLGEGVDVPAIEVISMARKTASFQLFAQQFGRSLRVMVYDGYAVGWHNYTDDERLRIIAASFKPSALIIDHVGNCIYHGLPDVPREYSLERGESQCRGTSDAIPLRACLECARPYERYLILCPYCGAVPPIFGRGSPELVEGDLIELDEAILRKMRGEIARIDGPPPNVHNGDAAGFVIVRNHEKRKEAQAALRRTMNIWGGWRAHIGESEREAQKRFWFTFGIDVMSAAALGGPDAWALNGRVNDALRAHGIVEDLQ